MTNLTASEKQALEEVFLCFQVEKKWYKRELYDKKKVVYKALRFFAKNRNALRERKFVFWIKR